jgi:large subunit ribosomal protein L16
MLSPKKFKFKKIKKTKICGVELKVNNPVIGVYGVKSLNLGRITSYQIEAVRKVISRKMNKLGFLRFTIFPCFPVTSKPVEVRMGKGKGSLAYWCFFVKPGRLLFEFHGVSFFFAFEIHKLIKNKLPVVTKLITYL